MAHALRKHVSIKGRDRGHDLARVVSWENGADVSSLAGKRVRLRFRLKDADLFALQFVP